MPKVETYACDVCGILKGKSNHWWMVRRADDGSIVIAVFDMHKVTDDALVMCGAEHLHKQVDEMLKAYNA